MSLYKHLLFSVILGTSFNTVFAQDPHYSQFAASPLTLNPALTGKFEGDIRAVANFKSQWATINNAYKTTSFAVDGAILKNATGENNTLGVGVMGYSDKTGNGALNLNYLTGSIAYNKGLDANGYHQIGIGLQATYAQQSLFPSKLQFADQLTEAGFTLASDENFNNMNKLSNHYFDMNAGIVYSFSTNENNAFYVGASAYHLSEPKQNFIGGTFQVRRRYNIHAGGYFPVGENTTLHLSAMHSTQNSYDETLAGAALQFNLGEGVDGAPINFYAGSWMRFNDAIIPYIGLEYSDFRLGISYDVNTSNLKTASQSQGGIELSLMYIFKNRNKGYIPCPKF